MTMSETNEAFDTVAKPPANQRRTKKPTVYFIPGLGVDERVFYLLDIKGAHRVYCNVFRPRRRESLRDYARRMIEAYDIQPDNYIVGLSFGGILGAEINDLVPQRKLILLSTIKNRSERPFWMKLAMPPVLRRFVPPVALKYGAIAASPFVGKMSYEEFDVYLSMVQNTDSQYYKWAIDQVVRWKREREADNVIHIHGRNDLIFPAGNIENYEEIDGGAHTLVLRFAKIISFYINTEIKNGQAAKADERTKVTAAEVQPA